MDKIKFEFNPNNISIIVDKDLFEGETTYFEFYVKYSKMGIMSDPQLDDRVYSTFPMKYNDPNLIQDFIELISSYIKTFDIRYENY